MFNLFKNTSKAYGPISEYPESWSILKEDSRRMIVRINVGYKDAAGHPDYPIKMGVALPINDGHDEKSVAALKNSMEDAVDEILNNGEKGILVAVITSLWEQKFMEFLSYTKNKLDFGAIHQTLKNKFPKEDVQMYANPDLKWSTYESFLK